MISSYNSFKTEVLRELSKLKEARPIQARISRLSYGMVYPFDISDKRKAILNVEFGKIANLSQKQSAGRCVKL
jgi:hypothetical protein